ncbi:MarR family transcriptional regulator [Pseudonocardia nematodicida]|uniref:MarR family transcriptional regulator n=1 Tax=Pseudonocardia nematodicida TaxID=1206997 RepID=A0ABV1KA37_9PSEU
MSDPWTTDWSPEQEQVMHRLRGWAVGYAELNRNLADHLALPGSDADALGHITWAAEAGTPLSPARLSRRIGMTSGATSILLNRLASAGYVERVRHDTDRRRVVLYPTPRARERHREFLALAGQEIADTLLGACHDELRTVITFLERMTAAAGAGNRRLDARRGR